MESGKLYYTAKEVAKIVGLTSKYSYKAVRRWVLQGYVKPRSNGRDLLFRPEDIDQLVCNLGKRRARV